MVINFISGGHTGDLIHELYIVKNICNQNQDVSNLYIADRSYNINQCIDFSFNLDKVYNDTKDLIKSQSYINDYQIFPKNFNEPIINISDWRNNLQYIYCWTDLLSIHYQINPPEEYKWINIEKIDPNTVGKILIHHSGRRFNHEFNWGILSNTEKDILFITSDIREWEIFKFKNEKIKPYLVSTVSEMATAINSCDLFIGNQSLPFAIACSLDKPRICELEYPSAMFYMNEKNYSENISWYLNDNIKYNSEKIEIKV